MHFEEPVFVGCMQLLGFRGSPSESLGKGFYKTEWDGGLAVEVSDDGKNWHAVEIEDQECAGCNKNIAIIIDGQP